MKKMMMMFALVGGLAFVGQAQSCCAGKKSAEGTASCTMSTDAANKAAAGDASIEKRVNPETGAACFVRKTVAQDGTASFAEVTYDAAVAKFVNVSPAAACVKPASATAACAKPGAACCAGKAASTSTTAVSAPTQKAAPAKTKATKAVKAAPASSSEKK